jgi:hypothetical protein
MEAGALREAGCPHCRLENPSREQIVSEGPAQLRREDEVLRSERPLTEVRLQLLLEERRQRNVPVGVVLGGAEDQRSVDVREELMTFDRFIDLPSPMLYGR